MPHLGAEAALYELLRILPDLGNEAPEIEELAELLRSTPEGVEVSLEALIEARFIVRRDDWLEVAEHPLRQKRTSGRAKTSSDRDVEVIRAEPDGVSADDYSVYGDIASAAHPGVLERLLRAGRAYARRGEGGFEDSQRARRAQGRLRAEHPGAVGRAGREDRRGRGALRAGPQAQARRAEWGREGRRS